MVKAVIFDCFGVLTASTYDLFYKKYFQDQPEKIEQARKLDHASNQGTRTLEDFYAGIAEVANIPVDEAREFISRYQANDELLDYIQSELKPNYKIGFLSNVADNLMSKLFTPDQIALFDDVVLSYEVGMAKPDPEIFNLSADRLNVKPEECIFVDDIEKYCQAAESTGMKAILYKDFVPFKEKMENMT